jgi:hypothetical protein
MTEKTATFYKNDQLLCLANGITGPMRPFVSIGSRDVIITLQSHDSRSLFDVKSHSPSSPMLEIAVRTGLDLVFALLEKEDNSRIRCVVNLLTSFAYRAYHVTWTKSCDFFFLLGCVYLLEFCLA